MPLMFAMLISYLRFSLPPPYFIMDIFRARRALLFSTADADTLFVCRLIFERHRRYLRSIIDVGDCRYRPPGARASTAVADADISCHFAQHYAVYYAVFAADFVFIFADVRYYFRFSFSFRCRCYFILPPLRRCHPPFLSSTPSRAIIARCAPID